MWHCLAYGQGSESFSASLEGPAEARDEDESGRDFAEPMREERDLTEPALDDCSDFGLDLRDLGFGLPLSDFCDLLDSGREEDCFIPDDGRDEILFSEGGRDETC